MKKKILLSLFICICTVFCLTMQIQADYVPSEEARSLEGLLYDSCDAAMAGENIRQQDAYEVPVLWSGDVSRWAFRHLVKKADLIFLGTVEHVDFETSSVKDTDDVDLPHTFVTFAIDSIAKGKTEKDRITLRFQGGMRIDSLGEPAFLIGSHIPQFDVGDRDILFVKNNGASICPLVGTERGRIRIIQGKLFSDLGLPVGIDELPDKPSAFLREDIINPVNLYSRLLNPQSEIDQHISRQLQKETLDALQAALQENPYSAKGTFARTLLAYDLNVICGFAGQKPIIGSSTFFLPGPPETVPGQLALKAENEGVALRTRTRELLSKNRADLTYAQKVHLNRLVLEDVYPLHIVRALQRSVVCIPSCPDPDLPVAAVQAAVNKYETLGLEFAKGPDGTNDGEIDSIPPAQQPPCWEKEGLSRATETVFWTYLQGSVQELHTADELAKIPMMKTTSPDEPFFVKAMKPVPIEEFDYPIPASAVEYLKTEQDILEEKALEKSGFNPVIK